MSPVSVKVGGVWKDAPSVYTKVGGAWKTAADMPVKVGGVWKTGILSSGAFEPIATATGTGSSYTISFTSIPQNYQHLQIRGVTSRTGSTDFQYYIGYNNDTGSNYAYHILYGNGSSAFASGSTSSTPTLIARANTATNNVSPVIIDIHDYASTSKTKVARSFNGWDNNGSGEVCLVSNLWNSTSAITRIDLTVNASAYWSTATTFALYGIKGA